MQRWGVVAPVWAFATVCTGGLCGLLWQLCSFPRPSGLPASGDSSFGHVLGSVMVPGECTFPVCIFPVGTPPLSRGHFSPVRSNSQRHSLVEWPLYPDFLLLRSFLGSRRVLVVPQRILGLNGELGQSFPTQPGARLLGLWAKIWIPPPALAWN